MRRPRRCIRSSSRTTSPAAMMDGAGGAALTNESIEEAVAFRQTVGRVHREFAEKRDWFFQHLERRHEVEGPERARRSRFEDARRVARDRPGMLGAASGRGLARLRRPRGWLLHARSDQGLDPDAGRRRRGRPRQARHPGEPRDRVPALSRRRGREDDRLHDPVPVLDRHHQGQVGHAARTRCSTSSTTTTPNAPLAAGPAAPRGRITPSVYGGLGLRELAEQMFAQLRESQQTHWLAEGVLDVPRSPMSPMPHTSPWCATRSSMCRSTTRRPRARNERRALPAGNPDVMPGEIAGATDGPYLGYLRRLRAWDKALPRLRSRHARRGEPRGRVLRAVPEVRRGNRGRPRLSAPGRKMSATQATMNGVVAPYRATVVTLAAHRKNRPKDVQVLRPARRTIDAGRGVWHATVRTRGSR